MNPGESRGSKDQGSAGSARAARERHTAALRRTAAEWVEAMTGVALPTASDHAFRGALRDGVLLCQLLNKLRPGLINKVRFATFHVPD